MKFCILWGYFIFCVSWVGVLCACPVTVCLAVKPSEVGLWDCQVDKQESNWTATRDGAFKQEDEDTEKKIKRGLEREKHFTKCTKSLRPKELKDVASCGTVKASLWIQASFIFSLKIKRIKGMFPISSCGSRRRPFMGFTRSTTSHGIMKRAYLKHIVIASIINYSNQIDKALTDNSCHQRRALRTESWVLAVNSLNLCFMSTAFGLQWFFYCGLGVTERGRGLIIHSCSHRLFSLLRAMLLHSYLFHITL